MPGYPQRLKPMGRRRLKARLKPCPFELLGVIERKRKATLGVRAEGGLGRKQQIPRGNDRKKSKGKKKKQIPAG